MLHKTIIAALSIAIAALWPLRHKSPLLSLQVGQQRRASKRRAFQHLTNVLKDQLQPLRIDQVSLGDDDDSRFVE